MLSVFNQDYPHIEYIIIDGGSTDGSIDIIRKYESRLAYWVSEKDTGTSEAINKGWRKSTGEFLWLFPSDDYLPRNSVSSAVKHLQKHPEIDFVSGDRCYIDKYGNFLALEHLNEFSLLKTLPGIGLFGPKSKLPSVHGSLMRRRTFEEVGYLDENIYRANDVDYLLRIALHHKIGYLPVPLGCFRVHSGSAAFSERLGLIGAHENLKIYAKLYSRSDLPPELLSIRQEAWAGAHHSAALSFLLWNQHRKGLQHLLMAAKLDPLRLFRWGFLRLLLPSFLGNRGFHTARSAYRFCFPRFTGKGFTTSCTQRVTQKQIDSTNG